MTVLKDCKSSQENVSLSLAKKKLDEKSEWKFPNEVMYASLYLRNRSRSFFFRLTHLEYEFMLASLVRLNLVVLKIWECPRSLPPAVL